MPSEGAAVSESLRAEPHLSFCFELKWTSEVNHDEGSNGKLHITRGPLRLSCYTRRLSDPRTIRIPPMACYLQGKPKSVETLRIQDVNIGQVCVQAISAVSVPQYLGTCRITIERIVSSRKQRENPVLVFEALQPYQSVTPKQRLKISNAVSEISPLWCTDKKLCCWEIL